MRLRTFVVVGLVGLSLAFGVATAEDAVPQTPITQPVAGVSFLDIGENSPRFTSESLAVTALPQTSQRFTQSQLTTDGGPAPEGEVRQVEVAVTGTRIGGSPIDVAFAQRASVGFNENGDVQSQHHGHEVRLGQRLSRGLGHALGVSEWQGGRASWDNPTWYLFVASDNDAIALRGGRITYQDKMEIGDFQAGITMERGPLRASFAYVQREINLQMWRSSSSDELRFTGITLTWRHQ